jgi:hypothetical protein
MAVTGGFDNTSSHPARHRQLALAFADSAVVIVDSQIEEAVRHQAEDQIWTDQK